MVSGIKAETGSLFTIAGWLPIPALQHALNLYSRLNVHAADAIQAHKASVTTSKDSDAVSLFAKFFDRSKNQELDDDEIAHEAANLTVAARDTTAVSLTYLIYMDLSPENQRVREELLREINDMPSDASASELGTLRYLRAVIDESLRLSGAAPGSLPRIVPARGASFGGYSFPAGTTVSTQAFTIHRDPLVFRYPERQVETFTDDVSQAVLMPSSFYPERWMNPT